MNKHRHDKKNQGFPPCGRNRKRLRREVGIKHQ